MFNIYCYIKNDLCLQLSTEAPDVLVVPTTSRTNEGTVENSTEINDISTQVTVETTPSTSVHRYLPFNVKILQPYSSYFRNEFIEFKLKFPDCNKL